MHARRTIGFRNHSYFHGCGVAVFLNLYILVCLSLHSRELYVIEDDELERYIIMKHMLKLRMINLVESLYTVDPKFYLSWYFVVL